MEEKILEIIDEVEYAKRNTYIPPAGRQKIMAKKIASLFKDWYPKEFVEWKDKNVGKTTTSSYWLGNKKFITLAELYEYWTKQIKG